MGCNEGTYSSPRVTSEYKDCSLAITFDQYNVCGYGFGSNCAGCLYCFSNAQKIVNPKYGGKFSLRAVNPDKIIRQLKGDLKTAYYDNFFKHRFPLHWGGLAEPFCPIELKEKVGLKILQYCDSVQYPIIFSTKGAYQAYEKDYVKIWKSYTKTKNLGWSFSIITNRDDIAAQVEMGVPSTTERLKAMKVISDMGFWTVLRLRPFIIGVSDIELEILMERAAEAGAKAISTEFFCIDLRSMGILKDRVESINKITDIDTVEYYRKLSPTSRGTYLRLNSLVKESYVKRMLKACKKYGLKFAISDPDFKAYNFSGCCCGYPETKEEYNSEICNWSRGQLTYHLSKLRKKYWEGQGKEAVYLTWDEVKNTVANDWACEHRYFSDSIKYWTTDNRKRTQGHINEFLETWNNTRAADNPYNYFDGVLVPDHLDVNSNIVFRYSPNESELRINKELGI